MGASQKWRCALLIATACAGGRLLSAGECCDHCGRSAACHKVCHRVREEKKVEVVCWGSKAEPCCVPGRSVRGCEHCESICETCQTSPDGTEPHAPAKRFLWYEWTPGSAQVYTRKKLMKKTVTVTVPVHKWVVEDLCEECRNPQAPAPSAAK